MEVLAFVHPQAQAVTLTVAQAFKVALDLWEVAQEGRLSANILRVCAKELCVLTANTECVLSTRECVLMANGEHVLSSRACVLMANREHVLAA